MLSAGLQGPNGHQRAPKKPTEGAAGNGCAVLVSAVCPSDSGLALSWLVHYRACRDDTGLPVRQLRRLCRSGEIQAVKLSGWWLVYRDEFMRLLDPASTLQWRSNRDRQQIFLRLLQDLAAMLHPCEASRTIQVLLKDLRRAVQARRDGAAYEETEGFAWRRAEWRGRWGVVDSAQAEDALLLRDVVSLGMPVFERIGWDADETAALVVMVRAHTGIEVWL